MTMLRSFALVLVAALTVSAPAVAQEAEPAPPAPPTQAQIAAIFAAWEGNWDGSGQEVNFENGEMQEVTERLAVRRLEDGGVRLIYDADPETALLLNYADGALIAFPGTEWEAREEIIDFAPLDQNGAWRIVTAAQVDYGSGLVDVVQAYHMAAGRYRHEIASRPISAPPEEGGAETAAPESADAGESDLIDFSIDLQMVYTRAPMRGG